MQRKRVIFRGGVGLPGIVRAAARPTPEVLLIRAKFPERSLYLSGASEETASAGIAWFGRAGEGGARHSINYQPWEGFRPTGDGFALKIASSDDINPGTEEDPGQPDDPAPEAGYRTWLVDADGDEIEETRLTVLAAGGTLYAEGEVYANELRTCAGYEFAPPHIDNGDELADETGLLGAYDDTKSELKRACGIALEIFVKPSEHSHPSIWLDLGESNGGSAGGYVTFIGVYAPFEDPEP